MGAHLCACVCFVHGAGGVLGSPASTLSSLSPSALVADSSPHTPPAKSKVTEAQMQITHAHDDTPFSVPNTLSLSASPQPAVLPSSSPASPQDHPSITAATSSADGAVTKDSDSGQHQDKATEQDRDRGGSVVTNDFDFDFGDEQLQHHTQITHHNNDNTGVSTIHEHENDYQEIGDSTQPTHDIDNITALESDTTHPLPRPPPHHHPSLSASASASASGVIEANDEEKEIEAIEEQVF